MSFQRVSKNYLYESPYTVKGSIVETGSEEKPKVICTDKITGTWKANDMETLISL